MIKLDKIYLYRIRDVHFFCTTLIDHFTLKLIIKKKKKISFPLSFLNLIYFCLNEINKVYVSMFIDFLLKK